VNSGNDGASTKAQPLEETRQDSGSPVAKVAAASVGGLSGRVLLLLVNLLATPFTIRLLGPALYGLWTLLLLSLTWASTSDVGMVSGSIKFGAERYARSDDRGETGVIWTALSVVGFTTSTVAVAIAIEAKPILSDLLHVSASLVGPGALALRIGCAVFVLQSLAQIVGVPQVVRLRWRECTFVTSTSSLVAAIGTPACLVILGGGVVTAEIVALAGAITWVLGNLVVAVRVQPRLLRPHFDRVALKQLFSYGGALMVAGLIGIPLTTAERFFLAHNHTTTVVAYYAVAATLATTLLIVPEQLSGPLLPGLVRLEAQGRLRELRELYQKGLMGMFLVMTPSTIVLAFLARPFLALWAGPKYGAHSTGPFLLVIVGVWFNCLAWIPYSYLLSSGRTKLIALVQSAELVPYLVGAWILTEKFGAIGAAMVWSARYAVDAVLCFAVVRRVAPMPILPLSERRLRSVASPLALVGAVLLAGSLSHDLPARIGWAVVLMGAYALVTWRWVLTGRERQGLLSLVTEVARRGPRPQHSLMPSVLPEADGAPQPMGRGGLPGDTP
jgi:O-antigen/teichoic acid export membrane protein